MTIISAVYKITNCHNGKIYIGSSQNVYQRWWQHRTNLRRNKHINSHLQRAWNKYGEESFTFEIIEKTTIKKLRKAEQDYLDGLEPWRDSVGYNLSKRGDLTRRGWHHPDCVKEKCREANIGKRRSPDTEFKKGLVPWNKGKPMSVCAKKKLSASLRGKPLSSEHRKKIGDALKEGFRTKRIVRDGHKWTKQQRKKFIASMKDKQNGEDNPNSKLTIREVVDIKKMLKRGVYRHIVAKKYAVSKACIQKIAEGKTWRKVA